MEAMKLPYTKLLLTVCMPRCATPKSVGLDLYSPINVLILAHGKVLIDTAIAFQIPIGYYGQIAPKLGLAIHHHIHVGAGVVDPDYTGSVHVLLMNLSSQDHVIEKNHRIAQMILEKAAYPIICEIPDAPNRAWCQWIWLQRAINKEGRNLISPSHPTKHENGFKRIQQCRLDNVFVI